MQRGMLESMLPVKQILQRLNKTLNKVTLGLSFGFGSLFWNGFPFSQVYCSNFTKMKQTFYPLKNPKTIIHEIVLVEEVFLLQKKQHMNDFEHYISHP